MKEFVKPVLVAIIATIIIGIISFIIEYVSELKLGSPEKIVAIIIIIIIILGWYIRRIIRKKDNEIASIRKQIEYAETSEQKSRQDVCGKYEVNGKNVLDSKEIQYSGGITIKEWEEPKGQEKCKEQLECEWEFGATKESSPKESIHGTGFLEGNTLALTFYYLDKKGTYLFSWSKVHRRDSSRLIEYVKDNFCAVWMRNSDTVKITPDDRTITLSSGKHSATITLNEKGDEATLKIDDKTQNLFAEKENDELKIYEGKNRPGVGLYVIKSDGSMRGYWTVLDKPGKCVEDFSKT